MNLLISLALASVTALSAAEPPGNATEGAGKSIACQACHGGDGISIAAEVPNLAGQKVQYLTNQLKAFRSGDRKHDIMNPVARQLSDTDIGDLAAFWSGLPPAAGGRETSVAALSVRHSPMAFPEAFPNGFTVYRTDEDAAARRISSYYANEVAFAAARKGEPLPAGAIIVVAMSPAKVDGDKQPLKDAEGHLLADAPRAYSAMEVRPGAGAEVPAVLRNGDWIYGLFNAQKARNDAPNYAMCLGCHKAKVDDSYLFSLKELREKAQTREKAQGL